MTETAEALIAYCRENQRVCPMPQQWQKLWDMLPERKQVGAGWQSPLPLILAAWNHTSDQEKIARLAEHIHWAEKHGALVVVADFLRGLPESQWHHEGE